MWQDRKNVKLNTQAGRFRIHCSLTLQYAQTVVLTDGPLSPTPGSPGSPLGPGFPCRATVLPMSVGSTGHTSHESPWRLSQTRIMWMREHTGMRIKRLKTMFTGTLAPLKPVGPLGPYENSRIPVRHWCISSVRILHNGSSCMHCWISIKA